MEASHLIALFVGLVAGIGAGVAAARAWPRLASGRAAEEEAERRQAAYRREVADHFVETAQLVNRLTDSYKEVFDHLRRGAGTLVDEETLRQRLANEEDKNVTLHLIGYREAGKKPSGTDGKPADPPKRSD